MNIDELKIDGYERIVHFADQDISGYIALHNTRLGPALGGCRIKGYASDQDALQDALNLSKGMSYKNSLAGLHFGGGKCVVNAPKATPGIMHMVGQAVEYLTGTYYTAEDVGTTIADMKIASEDTKFVASLGEAGDPSPWTARGVFSCIKAVCNKHGLWSDPEISKVWVQGLGKVGWNLAEHLCAAGRIVYVSDLLPERMTAVELMFGALPLPNDPDWVYREIQVYAPCAMGQVFNQNNYADFPGIICGSANNQLVSDDVADLMMQDLISYCPDFLVNAGGVIAVASEIDGFDRIDVENHIDNLGERLLRVFEMAEYTRTSPLSAAKALAEARW